MRDAQYKFGGPDRESLIFGPWSVSFQIVAQKFARVGGGVMRCSNERLDSSSEEMNVSRLKRITRMYKGTSHFVAVVYRVTATLSG